MSGYPPSVLNLDRSNTGKKPEQLKSNEAHICTNALINIRHHHHLTDVLLLLQLLLLKVGKASLFISG